MLSTEMTSGLNNQIGLEGFASNYYLSVASWCDLHGFEGGAAFFFAQSDEERQHMLKVLHYVNEAGGEAIVPKLDAPQHEFSSLKQIFEDALAHEVRVTKAIHALTDLCLSEKDFTTFSFLQWFINEQHEEENLFRTILDKIHLAGDDERGLFFVDKELKSLAGTGITLESGTAE